MNNDEEQIISMTPQLSVVESQERANIDMLIATAKKYPRDLVRVKRSMEAMATLDQETAESCNYHLQRNGKSIDGPSVRMAEIAVACYQNIRCGSRVLSNDGKVITGQAFCHDLENNTFIAWETQRRITDSKGRTYGEDMQVVTGNAASAIAFRNAVFKVIPGALIKPVADKARLVAVGDLKTLAQRRTRALKHFASIGVREDQILTLLEKANMELVDVGDVEKLFGIYTAIKDGSTTIEEQFPKLETVVKPKFSQPSPDLIPPDKALEKLAEIKKAVVAPPADYPEPDPAAEVMLRLKEADIPQDEFLNFLSELDLITVDPAAIEMGHYTIGGHAPKDVLSAALLDWDNVIKKLKGAVA